MQNLVVLILLKICVARLSILEIVQLVEVLLILRWRPRCSDSLRSFWRDHDPLDRFLFLAYFHVSEEIDLSGPCF